MFFLSALLLFPSFVGRGTNQPLFSNQQVVIPFRWFRLKSDVRLFGWVGSVWATEHEFRVLMNFQTVAFSYAT